MKLPFLSLKMMVKRGLEFILKLNEPLQSCCCHVQKNQTRKAELAWQVSRYLWRGSVNFKIKNSRPLFAIIFKPKIVVSRFKIFKPFKVLWSGIWKSGQTRRFFSTYFYTKKWTEIYIDMNILKIRTDQMIFFSTYFHTKKLTEM